MGNFTLNLIFASVFGGFAWNSLPRGWRFFRAGYLAYRANINQPDSEFDVEQQRDLQLGSNFLIAGLGWLLGGLISALLTIIFVAFAFLDIGVFDLLS